jgi:aldehyde:ferredoxin oxidoreductase
MTGGMVKYVMTRNKPFEGDCTSPQLKAAGKISIVITGAHDTPQSVVVKNEEKDIVPSLN